MQPLLMDSLQGSILQDCFLSVGTLPTKTLENRYALSSPVKAWNQRGPWGPGGSQARQDWRDPFSYLHLGLSGTPSVHRTSKGGTPNPRSPSLAGR